MILITFTFSSPTDLICLIENEGLCTINLIKSDQKLHPTIFIRQVTFSLGTAFVDITITTTMFFSGSLRYELYVLSQISSEFPFPLKF